MTCRLEHGKYVTPELSNERILEYLPNSAERIEVAVVLNRMSNETIDLPLIIDGKAIRTGRLEAARMPHAHSQVLGNAHLANADNVSDAIAAAGRAWSDWSRCPWHERAAIFLKAADLLAGGWRSTLNAATMLGQSKTVIQAEIDSAAELIDFWRFNVHFMERIYAEQPLSARGVWNQVDYRPLEGFVYAVTPFNFTAIAGNLPTAPALMGNTVLWKPSAAAKYSAHFVMQLLQAAGLPAGVINLVYGDADEVTKVALTNRTLAGLHFTGSTDVFNELRRNIAAMQYRSYPRVVGETGGKNFVLVHESADVFAASTAILRGAFEYQGQKCSAASRVYVPESLWPRICERLCDDICSIKVGDVRDFGNFMGAVIDERAWRRHAAAIAAARHDERCTILAGGAVDMSEGYFISPTLVRTTDPQSTLMKDELFGPIVTAFVYPDAKFDEIIALIDSSSDYGLTGAIFAQDREAIARAATALRYAAGNFYINDKPTGAVVGQQPFGGARGSGTNDKAGSIWNLARWVSPRAIKESFCPPTKYGYAHMAPERVRISATGFPNNNHIVEESSRTATSLAGREYDDRVRASLVV
jgi:1-pyrroline-5-carboxylate dehydrogenase